jgi:hypothetical protein
VIHRDNRSALVVLEELTAVARHAELSAEKN